MNLFLKLLELCFTSFGVILFIMAIADIIRMFKRPRRNKNRIYVLCERYVKLYDSGDGYWLTDTEIQLYNELEVQLKKINIIK